MTRPQLPHGPGFTFLDEVEAGPSGTSLVGRKWLDPELPFFSDHFPGEPIMPGVLMIECAAQAAGALWNNGATGAAAASMIAQVGPFKFMKKVVPGQTLEVSVSLKKDFGSLAQFEVELRVGQDLVACGQLALSRG